MIRLSSMVSKTTSIARWDVFWAVLDPVVGSEQGGRRPVVILSRNRFNTTMSLVTAVPLTKLEGKRRPAYAFEVMLPRGLLRPGITTLVMPQQVRTVSKRRLGGRIGRITDPAHRAQIEQRLLDHLGIETEIV